MKLEKIKGRKRIVQLGKDDWFETGTGVKFPIKTKPMIFSEMHQEFNLNLQAVATADEDRIKHIKDGIEFDWNEYKDIVNNYMDSFYEVVITVTNFNGYEVDIEFIKNNMGFDDPYFYMQTVSLGRPVYAVNEILEKKKK